MNQTNSPKGSFFGLPHVIDWLDKVLPDLDAAFDDGRQSPLEQVDDIFHDFVSGADFSFYERSHSMNPTEPGVWELKTADLLFFGWFTSRGVFIIANVDSALRCKDHGLYAGYRDDVIRRRNSLDLTEPKFIRDVL